MPRGKTQEEFENEVFNLLGSDYTVLGLYINNTTKIRIKHNVCKYEWDVFPTDFIRNHPYCHQCYGKRNISTKRFKEKVFNLVQNKYEVLGEYHTSETKIKMKHNVCGNEFEVTPNSILNGRGCPKCFGSIRKTTEQFKKEIYNLVYDEYCVLEEYVSNRVKILMKHNVCGNEYKVAPDKFLVGNRCPKCAPQSKMEFFVRNWLINNNILHKEQYWFSDCRNQNPLRFDFAIFDQNNQLLFLLELDGKQHFKVSTFGKLTEEQAQKEFELTQKRDQIKNEYCTNNNIALYRIPYSKFKKLGDILEELINKHIN